jgi:acetyltransferase-like isoleucine patch superfamily enzyme
MSYLTIDPNADIGHPVEYFTDREVELDCRGPLHISPLSDWGIGVKVITASHQPGNMSVVKYLPITVEAGAWVCSYAILYNCHIGENSVVALGSVVRSRDVPGGTMVEGNPARIIARLVNDKWEYLDFPIPLRRKK